MSCTGTADCICGCCAGASVQTPQVENNLPGQSSIVYRAGTWATFKESMLARLSAADYPALSALTTRDDDDFTIAFLDATSMVLDILTFYQERLANESYLRTAGQLRSLTELSRLIGYQPSPGVAASTYLAFTLKAAPGQPPDPTTPAITIPAGSQVQSVPAQGQTPQVFETSAAIQAKPDWNALQVQTSQPWIPPGATSIYLSGVSTQLNLGDALLILGVDRESWDLNNSTPSEQWDIVIINDLQVDNVRKLTYVGWDLRLSHESGDGASGNPAAWSAAKVFAFRQRAALFGHNAPSPNLFTSAANTVASPATNLPQLIDVSTFPWQWNNYRIASSSQIDLDATYQKLVVGSWFALSNAFSTSRILVLDSSGSLWMQSAPLSSAPSTNVLIDKSVQAFQALSATQIFVLGKNGNLWLEQAPFGIAPPARVAVDRNVRAFQALSATEVFVLGDNGNVWFEEAPFGNVPPTRVQVDANTKSFQALSATQVFVLGNDGNLWLEQGPFGNVPPPRVQVDATTQKFQAISATEVYVLGNNGNLWIEHGPFGHVPPSRVLVGEFDRDFQVVGNLIFELGTNNRIDFADGTLDKNVRSFQALSSTEVLVVDTSGNIWLEYGPFDIVVPPQRVKIDAIMAAPAPSYVAQLYKIQRATTVSIANFGLSGKVTELAADYSDPAIATTFPLPATQVWGQSDQLVVPYQPLDYPLYGRVLDLQDVRPDLVGTQVVALSGNRQKLTVADEVINLSFVPDDGSDPSGMPLKPGDVVTLTRPSPLPLNPDFSVPDWSSVPGTFTLFVEDASGRSGTIAGATLTDFELALSGSSDPEVSEYALVTSVISNAIAPYPHTQLLLQNNLINCYDRNSTTVNANVGLATNGQSVSEIMGSGSASTPNQYFTLKQSPLTYVSAPTPSGRQSTLQVIANGVTWTEVPILYQQGPSQQVFSTLNQTGGVTEVLFGDGVEAATLPTGQNNIQANYRIGTGSSGNVAANAITTLMDRPLGVSGVTNPEAAAGGQDPDSIDDIRSSAPQTVLTLGRAVSITDYQSYASTFAGIVKAYAIWIPYGPGRGVFLTVAGADGVALEPGDPTLANLVTSLHNYGNPLIPISAVSFLETLFELSANLQYDPRYDQPTVKSQVLSTLYQTYSFAQRTFGQGVSVDEVAAVIQAVPGLVAVNVIALTPGPTSAGGDLASQPGGYTLANFKDWMSQQVTLTRPSSDPTRICPYLPVANVLSLPQPAEILVLDPNPANVVLGVMS